MKNTELLNKLRANQRFLAQELMARGVEVELISEEHELLLGRYKRHFEYFLDIDSSLVPYTSSIISGDKELTKKILEKAGISVPTGKRFFASEKEEITACALSMGFPVVVKPTFGVQGENVYVNIETIAELEAALDRIIISRGDTAVLVEECFPGREHRLFVTKDAGYAVIHRDPAYVIGNGSDSLYKLAMDENERRNNPRTNCLCPITLDAVSEAFLMKSGRDLRDVPQKGEKVYLRGNSNLKTGGMAEDVTDTIHESVLEIGMKVLSCFPGMPYAGIDFMTKDIRVAQDEKSYRIIEVNSLPGIGMHIAPGIGKSRNVTSMIVDMIFPETKARKTALAA